MNSSPLSPPSATGDDTGQPARMLREARAVLRAESAGLQAMIAAMEDGNADGGGLGAAFIAAVEGIWSGNRRVVVTGMGKSGHIGRKIQATLASTGTPAIFVHPAEASHGDLGMLQKGDAVLAISNSGETAEMADIISHARRFGLLLIAMTARAGSTLAQAADIVLLLPHAPEACPIGLAPTTSSTMQLALGDALAIVLLQRRGFSASDFGIFHPGGRLGTRLRRVRELMHTGTSMPLGPPDMKLRRVIVEMTRKAFGCMGVVDAQGRLLGLITDHDLRLALGRDLDHTLAADIMNSTPQTISPDLLAAEALRVMNDRPRPISSIFALDEGGHVVGILHLHDLLRAGIA
ncbi:D-arabinose 5-phosphate [Komagataeibacter nataicola]|uniref:D-arabinose 5-phosphate n=1 Tax=Komagataeibacter nataicola TaxID=265960 RepID=A0A9N7CF21_9PROT|nr:KpsF/GutQ family sugar-phosphate isomerase [Komagataeibacter nataicola]AQU88254.1 D-arabinose 5-phosphate [Komagataeibacter nataicola]PYD67688.1 KpsF/GutQ family sugar-phosphate isomerase [Komagataeibacter nataicola]WEQ54645.1 KpsF/GutQ family sugar-phosphate isomerase [Komagataeibacter nataicola]WNM09010.1 KpsF/GutQ family sugar-phosphate isomerase [Komagataeibacter nataicola]GBR13947.1 arabinose-5-phosphate isomerase GutQ [Komagataeibacter nataicola NRIC 0616]